MSKNVTPIRTVAKAPPVRHAKPAPTNAVSVRLPTMCEMLGISISTGQKLLREGAVHSTKIGKSRLISVRSIEALINGEAA